jgi:hypothetical protein
MKTIKNHVGSLGLTALMLVSLLAACGGGGDDEAGSPTTFSIQPATVTFTAPEGSASGVCFGGGSQDVYVYGGAAPYRIDNTAPDYLAVNKTKVDNRGGNFTVTTVGGCLTNGILVIVDSLDKQVIFTVNNNPVGQ